jgi:hypothetical protein
MMDFPGDFPFALSVPMVFLAARIAAGAANLISSPAAWLVMLGAGMLVGMSPATGLLLPPGNGFAHAAVGLMLFAWSARILSNDSIVRTTGQTAHQACLAAIRAIPVMAAACMTLLMLMLPGLKEHALPYGLALVGIMYSGSAGSWLELLLAGVAWLLLTILASADTRVAGQGSALLISLAVALVLFITARLTRQMDRPSGKTIFPGSVVLRHDATLIIAMILAFGLRGLGSSWGLAGLVAGSLYGLALLRRNPASDLLRQTRVLDALTTEAGHVVAFLAGISLQPGHSVIPDPARSLSTTILLLCLTVLIPIMQGLPKTSEAPLRQRILEHAPLSTAALAICLFIHEAGVEPAPLILAITLTNFAALPFIGRQGYPHQSSRDGRSRLRPLVGVSRRGQAAGLLGFAAALSDSDQPVRVVCVATLPGDRARSEEQAVPDPGGAPIGDRAWPDDQSASATDPADPAEAEESLVRAVAAGASMGLRIIPQLISSGSTAAGLAKSAVERQADCIVIGWSTAPTPSDRNSQAIVDILIRTSQTAILTVNHPDNFRKARRLILAAMAGSMEAADFQSVIQLASTAWNRPAAFIEIMLVGGDDGTTPIASRPASVTSIQTWRELPDMVRRKGLANVAFFVAAVRPDWPSWNPGTERLPVVISEAFPDAALAVFYAGLQPGSADDQGKLPELPGAGTTSTLSGQAHSDEHPDHQTTDHWPPIVDQAARAGRILPGMPETALVDAIRVLTGRLFPDDRNTAGRLAADFSAIARTEPIQLAPGILLLHAHAHGLTIPAMALGTSKTGWRLVALPEIVRIVIILVSPAAAGPAVHLEALTMIARAIRDNGLATTVLAPDAGQRFADVTEGKGPSPGNNSP